MSGRLAGKVALVSGAGQTPGETLGNGRATAVLFAREGASVVCADRVLARAREAVDQIEAEGGAAIAVEADVTRAEACVAMVEAACARFGGLDILVNNVGIGGGDGPVHKIDEDAFDRILRVNLKGAVLATRAALSPMRAAGRGCIVNVSSLASAAGGFQVAYEVSKAALNRLTTSTAQSNASRGVRCNAVLPGFIDTPMAVEGIAAAQGRPVAEVRAERDARVPLGGKMGEAWDVAFACLFLASDEAKFITGALLPVDGGMGVRIG